MSSTDALEVGPVEPSYEAAHADAVPIASTPRRISEVDLLRVMNAHYKHINKLLELQAAQHRVQELLQQVQEQEGAVQAATKELLALRDDLAARYGIDFTKEQVREEDGVILPIATATSPAATG